MSPTKYTSLSDEQLGVRLAQRDIQALDEAYRRFSGRLLAFVARFHGGDTDLARDEVQDTFLRAIDQIDKFDPSRPLLTWLFSIAAHLAKDSLRASKRHIELLQGNSREQSDASPETALAARIDGSRVQALLADESMGFGPDDILLIHLRFTEGMRIAEVADALGVPTGTAKSRLHYLLRTLAENLCGTNRRDK